LEKHHKVFQEISEGIPPSRGHEHQIELILGSTHNKRTYRYPHKTNGRLRK